MSPFIAEFVGTAFLILFGNGVVCNVLLSQTNGNKAGWIVIAAGWGIAVFIGAFCSEKFSGAHLNPALSIAMLVAGKQPLSQTLIYIVAQMAGAMFGALLVYLFYREHFRVTDDAQAKLGCFCNSPAIRKLDQAFFCEAIGTFALIFPIFLMVMPTLQETGVPVDQAPVLGLGALGLLPVGLLVFGIGLSLGGTTGYAINPARDLGPRIVHAILPIPGKRNSDWEYSWIPVAGPIAGGILAAVLFRCVS